MLSKTKKTRIQYLYLLIFIAAGMRVDAQRSLPSFIISPTNLSVPAFLPGIMKDPSAILLNDTLFYTLNGQFFNNGFTLARA